MQQILTNSTNSTNVTNTTNGVFNLSNIFNLNSIALNNTADQVNNTTNATGIEDQVNNTTNATNTTNLDKNVYRVNDVLPSSEPIPGDVNLTGSGTYMDGLFDIDMSGVPEEPQKPHPKWYQFWQWIDYGFKYVKWCCDVTGWGFNHLGSMNKLSSICKHIISDSKS